jgi:hypothetical protein
LDDRGASWGTLGGLASHASSRERVELEGHVGDGLGIANGMRIDPW